MLSDDAAPTLPSADLTTCSTLPAPPSSGVLESSSGKRCGCGRTFTAAEWVRLPYVGRMELTEETDVLLRNCPCGSSVGVEVPRLTEPEVRRNGMRHVLADRKASVSRYVAEYREHVEHARMAYASRRPTEAWNHLTMAAAAMRLARRTAREDVGSAHAYLTSLVSR